MSVCQPILSNRLLEVDIHRLGKGATSRLSIDEGMEKIFVQFHLGAITN